MALGTLHDPVAAVLDRMEREADAIAAGMTEAVFAEVPDHAAVRDPRLAGEVREHALAHVHAFVACARRGRPPAGRELDFVRERGARRARELMPLEAVLQSYLLGQRLMWEAVVERAGDDVGAALALTRATFAYAGAINAAVADAHARAWHEDAADVERARRDVLERLLAGGAADAALRRRAQALGLDVEAEHAVAVVAVDDEEPGALRRAVNAVAGSLGPHRQLAFVVPLHGEVVALVPEAATGPGGAGAALRRAVGVLARAGAAAPRAGLGGPAPLADLPRACADARRALARAGAPRPVVAYADLALVDELTAGADASVRRLVPAGAAALAARPELARTVLAYAEHDLNVARTASALHVHANTVHYRLRQVAELTGSDPRRFGDLLELTLALRLAQGS